MFACWTFEPTNKNPLDSTSSNIKMLHKTWSISIHFIRFLFLILYFYLLDSYSKKENSLTTFSPTLTTTVLSVNFTQINAGATYKILPTKKHSDSLYGCVRSCKRLQQHSHYAVSIYLMQIHYRNSQTTTAKAYRKHSKYAIKLM